ncbi:MAG: ABC transporter ATP-binding protein [Bryobacteraceae bacterium]|jgi:ABC-type polysaccharide/polyol phosphate transport system ATPase subunit
MLPALRFERVTKTFIHHTGQKLLRERLIEMLRPSRRPRFEALKNISFQLMPGDSLGLIGPNGAGKSTILSLATGLLLPDHGSVRVNGRVTALLELGAGFHPDLTGAENVRVHAAMMGVTRRQMAERFDEIVEFSGVREFINEPMRVYSAGMTVRLGFSVAIAADPEVLLIDEVLGVGDQAFYSRCLDRIKRFQRDGKTMVLASHSAELITMMCQRALWLERGDVVKQGTAAEVVAAYKATAT